MSSMGVFSGLLRYATPSLTHSTPLAAALSSAIASSHRSYSKAAAAAGAEAIQWVFLGAPGVGKGTYASRAAKHFNVAHIATGDLIREEIKAGSELGKQVQQSQLCPHACMLQKCDGLMADAVTHACMARRSLGSYNKAGWCLMM